ncbi:MAG: hypothetical protein ABJD07_05170 [Gemmatimonadaceae bacterium]
MRRLALLAVVLVASPAISRAQDRVPVVPPVDSGTRVRVWTNLDIVSGFIATRGTVLSRGRDTLVVAEDYNDTLPRRIALGAITRLDVSRGTIPRRQGIISGARVGALAGIAASPLLALRDRHTGDGAGTLAGNFLKSALITGAEGMLIGAFLGTALRHTKWERIYERIDFSLLPAGDARVAVRVTR